ncbi:MAG: hypothetical protein ORN49_09915, partial [Rhodobacteraceae bacterium]|nr:hypothetical protein [Paracoccaceae bacterium]
RQDRAVYDLPPGTARAASLSRPVSFGVPEVLFLDLPQLTDSTPAHQPLIAADAQPWPGTLAVFRSPALDGFSLLTTSSQRAKIGTLAADFYAGPVSRFDLGNAMVVDFATGVMQSVTDVALFAGANVLAVEAAPGVWEVLQAGNADLIAPGRYRLTRLLRGQRGTESAMGNPSLTGSRVVIVDTSVSVLPVAQSDIGLPWNWRIGPASRPVSDASYAASTFAPSGIGLRPFSACQVVQPWRTARSPGDLTISWIRRSRALAADSWEAAEAPLAEDSEAYVVEILDGATVKRTLTTAATSALYSAAQQTTDWGAPLAPGAALTIRIVQLSQAYGRGAPQITTLFF